MLQERAAEREIEKEWQAKRDAEYREAMSKGNERIARLLVISLILDLGLARTNYSPGT